MPTTLETSASTTGAHARSSVATVRTSALKKTSSDAFVQHPPLGLSTSGARRLSAPGTSRIASWFTGGESQRSKVAQNVKNYQKKQSANYVKLCFEQMLKI
mmetsp:Transcript_53736/g.94836  ORF Transcript_53736/g.94836 Transcript_53736/m.94836 type:complete len:101 (+) Transcript_53736:545-847(+)